MSCYDEVPYASNPFALTHPKNLYLMASLFGVPAVEITTARVLELGCASGGNIIPLASNYPDATFIGIDLSSKQIGVGRHHIRQLGLRNIQLIDVSIADIAVDFGEFDYIIAHGLHSWVTESVQKKIISVFKHHLSPDGIGHLSFNTRPGWNVVDGIRKLMLMHTVGIDDPTERAAKAREIAAFVHRSIPNQESAWSVLLGGEISHPSFNKDYYLLHDHLEQDNNPVYLHELVDQLEANALQYLTDLEFMKHSPYLLSKESCEAICNIQSKTAAEQYLDFINNRRFRQMLICREHHTVPSTVTTKLFNRISIKSNLKVANLNHVAQMSNRDVISYYHNKFVLSVSEPVIKVALQWLAQLKAPINWLELIDDVAQYLQLDKFQVSVALSTLNFEQLMAYEAVELSNKIVASEFCPASANRKPQALTYSRYQATFTDVVTNRNNECVSLDKLGQALIPLLNGERTMEQVVDAFSDAIRHGEEDHFELLFEEGEIVFDRERVLSNIAPLTKKYVEILALNSLLQ